MATASERQRVQAMVDELLAKLRSKAPPAPVILEERERRRALAGAANKRAITRHGRPLAHWYDRWEREQEAREEELLRYAEG